MPLIRYRTGDYTRILPPCKCGGVTKRLDTVSRKEDAVSIEKLDSELFRIPELVDYRVDYADELHIYVRLLDLSAKKQITERVQKIYPNLILRVSVADARLTDTPMYPGKRYVGPEVLK